jgi:hypothetical protein
MGSLASKRYALLNRTPFLAHEELLCRSAVLLSDKLSNSDPTKLNSEHPYTQYCVKSCFVRLMRLQRRTRGLLAKMGSQICYKPKLYSNLSCSMCRRDCYITHVACGCTFDPICLHHGKKCQHFCFCRLSLKFIICLIVFFFGVQNKSYGAALVNLTGLSMSERTYWN